ncbi:sulfurtransferase-like selenium metabolism protein YedF [Raoultibacter massiliensis]|uniref:sulfurtransferase-like selenium metabolism protein YedF n=1 Tax=Raoultibacter massiliensis TaxID=1852371 RepID=UPI003A8FC19D
MKTIDAFGLACPKPLVLAKKEIDAGCTELEVRVDNETAVKNLTRLGEKTGLSVAVDAIEGGWLVAYAGAGDNGVSSASRGSAPSIGSAGAAPACTPVACSTGAGCGYCVFVGSDGIGSGDDELGRNLMKMALYTLAEAGDPPVSLLFMNAGVKLVAGGECQVAESVASLIEQGTEVLVCGTCLDFYGLKDALAVGEVSNMYDILERMREASKVVSL